ncbi:MAG: hypothetical protein ACREAC_10155, partial [Blastocatellia bacterium]
DLIPQYCLQPINNKTVAITFPDGKQYKFQSATSPQCQLLDASSTAESHRAERSASASLAVWHNALGYPVVYSALLYMTHRFNSSPVKNRFACSRARVDVRVIAAYSFPYAEATVRR